MTVPLKRSPLSRRTTAVLALAAGLIILFGWLFRGWSQPPTQLNQISRWADTAQWDRAEAAATEYIARRPRDARGLMLAARIAAGRNDLERCANLLARVPGDSPSRPEALLRQAQSLQELGHGQRTEAVWKELLMITDRAIPAHAALRAQAHGELVALYFLERRRDEARSVVWEMYPPHREKWRLLISLARIHGKPVAAAQARPMLDQFLASDPTDRAALRALAQYALDDKIDEAVALARRCLALDDRDQSTLEVLLECHVRNEDWQSIDAILSRSDLDPKRPGLWRLRGMAYLRAGRSEQAAAAFQEALRIEPFDATTHYQLGQALRRGSTVEAAQEHLRRADELRSHQEAITTFLNTFVYEDTTTWRPPDPAKCVELASHCRALGRRDEARGWLDQALLEQPNFESARSALEELNQPEQSP